MIIRPTTAAALLALAAVACTGRTKTTTPAASSIVVSVTPAWTRVAPGAQTTFTATVTGTANGAVTWSVQEAGGGTIDGAGTYTAPATPGTYHVVATSQADPTRHGAGTADVAPSGGGGTGKWVTGYYAHWLRHAYPIAMIDWSALTHIAVANVSLETNGALWNPMPDGADTNAWACEIADAAHAAGKKAILMVGGVGSAADFAAATADDVARARFVKEIGDFALRPRAQGGCAFDGLDIDWETLELPAHGPLVVKLVNDLRAAWPGIILTLAVGWDGDNPWFGTVHHLFDQINVMTYAISGDWGGWKSWHHAALYGDDSAQCTSSGCNHPSSVSAVIKWMRDDGVPPEKLGIGIGFYGTVWSGGSPPVTGPLQTISNGVFCDRDSDNTNTYAHIMEAYYTPAAYRWDDVAKVGYLTYPSGHGPANATWISYEDPQSIQAKGDFVKAQGLGGTIIWLVQHGCTNPVTGENPPLAAVKAAFLE